MNGKSTLFTELKRRHVWRVAVAYVVVAWLLLQLASIVLPAFGAPGWVLKVLIAVFVILFPVAVILAWAFEVTPEGVRRTESAHSPEAREARDTRLVGRKLNTLIIAVLALAVAALGWRLYAVRHAPAAALPGANAKAATPARASITTAPASPPTLSAQAIPAKSIAVLPFENLSQDKDNAYFVAGMQDLILTKLADIGSLKVISRTSTMQYGSRPSNLKAIGQQLGAATILEGSVQKQGKDVLINVQLIDARNDHHLWAETYPRTLDNVFGVEGEVAGKIAEALQAKLSPAETTRLTSNMSADPAANDLFLRAEYQANQGNTNYDVVSMRAALPLYQQAIAKAPDFALAYARLSFDESQLAWFGGGGMDVKQLIADARSHAEQAVKLAPSLAAAHLAIGFSDYWGRGDYDAALKSFAVALTLKPNDTDALVGQGYVARRQGQFDAATAYLKQAFGLDSRNSLLASEIAITCMTAGRYPDAERWFQRALALDPHNQNAKLKLSAVILFATGDIPGAWAAAQGDAPALVFQRIWLLTLQRKYREALALLDRVPDTPDNFTAESGDSKALEQAELYRLQGDTSQARPLYAQASPRIRAQLTRRQPATTPGVVWQNLAFAELGLGHTSQGLAAAAKAHALNGRALGRMYIAANQKIGATLYAEARRPDLAVPLLAKALDTPGIGYTYSPVMLWLDPSWDPIRHDPGFQALLKKYAKFKPAVTYPTPPVSASASSQD